MIKTQKHVIENIKCHKRENQIFPGQWTTDIERVYDYHKKTISKNSGSIRFTLLFYIIVFFVFITILLSYLYTSGFLNTIHIAA